jgi:DNA repair protein RadC
MSYFRGNIIFLQPNFNGRRKGKITMGENKNCHDGHRERMRNRLRESKNLDSFAEHEILEMLLFYVYPRCNTNEIAHKILQYFGSLDNLLSATVDEIVASGCMTEKSAVVVNFFGQLIDYAAHLRTKSAAARNYSGLSDYAASLFTDDDREQIVIFCLDESLKVIDSLEIPLSDWNSKRREFMEIAHFALINDCGMLAVAHNKPDDGFFDHRDAATMQSLEFYLGHIDITLFDLFIVNHGDVFSLRNSGFM